MQTAELVKDIAPSVGLKLNNTIKIFSYPESEAHRELLVFGLSDVKGDTGRFVIYDAPKVYSQQYQDTLKPFFTIFA